MRELHIFDFDGTLVDSSHRYRTINGKIDLDYWRKNEPLAIFDKPLPLFKTFKRYCKDKNKLCIIATARIWDDASQFYASVMGIDCPIIARKNENDNRGGAELKIKGIKRLLNLKPYQNRKIVIHEDNKQYLKDLVAEFNATGIFHPSKQGH